MKILIISLTSGLLLICLTSIPIHSEELTLGIYHDRKEDCPNKEVGEALHGKFEWAIEMPLETTLYANGFQVCNMEGEYYLKKCVPLMYVPFKLNNIKVTRINEEQYKAVAQGKYGLIDCREKLGNK